MFPNGCMISGRTQRATICRWHWNCKKLVLTRTHELSFPFQTYVISNPRFCQYPPAWSHPLSWQDAFVKVCEKTYTETERESNKVAVGWYSKEDMKNSLKWNAILDFQQKHIISYIVWSSIYIQFHFWRTTVPKTEPRCIPGWHVPTLEILWVNPTIIFQKTISGYQGRKLMGPSKFAWRMKKTLSGWSTCWLITGKKIIEMRCKYSGEEEYWVEVRETGERGQEREQKKQRKEIAEDSS